MALKGCYACLKYMVLIVNLIFWLAGFAVLAFSLWLLFDTAFYLKVTDSSGAYFTGTYLLLAAGALMTMVGFLGCCGAYRESQCMLGSFFVFLLLILVAEIAAGAWAWNHRVELNKMVLDSVKATVRKEYKNDLVKTDAFDAIQQALHCCGADGPSDWANSAFNNADEKSAVEIGISSLISTYRVPESCCTDMKSDVCKASTTFTLGARIAGTIYNEGCATKMVDLLQTHAVYIAGIAIGLGVVELLGMIFSMLLCCAIRKIEDFKA